MCEQGPSRCEVEKKREPRDYEPAHPGSCSSMNSIARRNSQFDQTVKNVYLSRWDDRMYLFNSC